MNSEKSMILCNAIASVMVISKSLSFSIIFSHHFPHLLLHHPYHTALRFTLTIDFNVGLYDAHSGLIVYIAINMSDVQFRSRNIFSHWNWKLASAASMAKLCFLHILMGLVVSFLPSLLSCPDQQKQALLLFKSSLLSTTASPNGSLSLFSSLDSWNSTSDCCRWERVVCKSGSMMVRGLHLYSLASRVTEDPLPLDAAAMAPLFSIRSLMLLDLSSNYFEGEISGAGFANFSKLVYLDLMQNKFSGSIPPQMYRLSYLQYLDMSSNSLGGALSPEVGFLGSLRALKLDGNFLKGNLPKEIGNLKKLQQLFIRGNSFEGEIPRSVLDLKSLEILDMRDNLLTMEIPPEIGTLSNLTTLALSNNKLNGTIPKSIQIMGNLKKLELENNLLGGQVPLWLFDMEGLVDLLVGGNLMSWNSSVKDIEPKFKLSRLSLKSCGLVGEIPRWISLQKNLDYLDLSENQLEGAFPLWLAEMDLGGIILSDNKLSGSLPPRLFQSQSLSALALSRNNFSGELPENIGDANSIMFLMLSGNNFSGKVPKSISNIYRLLLLDLSRNRLAGDIFPVIDPNAFLAYVDFSSNEFSGEIPTTLSRQTRILSLGDNRFSGSLPKNLTNWNLLEHLDLHSNNISGELPEFLSELRTLRVLSLRNNSLTGPIPESISKLSSLRILDLSGNKLVGKIPTEIGELMGMIDTPSTFSSLSHDLFNIFLGFNDLIVNWKKSKLGLPSMKLNIYALLDLSGNHLSGEIPASVGNLKGIKLLNLAYNNLSGNIPSSFGDLESVETLDLSHNKLSGSIPETLSKLPELTVLDLSNNELTGRIPVGGQMDTMNILNFYANNSGLCGIQIRVPCPEKKPLEKPAGVEGEEKEEELFSWAAAGIGFPMGFVVAVSIVHLYGYLGPLTLHPHLLCKPTRQRPWSSNRMKYIFHS